MVLTIRAATAQPFHAVSETGLLCFLAHDQHDGEYYVLQLIPETNARNFKLCCWLTIHMETGNITNMLINLTREGNLVEGLANYTPFYKKKVYTKMRLKSSKS